MICTYFVSRITGFSIPIARRLSLSELAYSGTQYSRFFRDGIKTQNTE